MAIKATLIIATGAHISVSEDRAVIIFNEFPDSAKLAQVVSDTLTVDYQDMVECLEVDELNDYQVDFEKDSSLIVKSVDTTGHELGALVLEAVEIY